MYLHSVVPTVCRHRSFLLFTTNGRSFGWNTRIICVKRPYGKGMAIIMYGSLMRKSSTKLQFYFGKWARNSCDKHATTCDAATGNGHVPMLKWARNNGYVWDVMNSTYRNIEHGGDAQTNSSAVVVGRLYILQRARANQWE